jgi:RNA polymerase sigma factor (sigma-70 family)
MLCYCDGELAAFKELYSRHSAGLYRFIAWRSPRKEWVDEIMQDSWAALHTARANYKVEASFKTYLYQIARNRLIDLVRQHHPILASDLGNDNDGLAVFDHLADHTHDGATPEVILQKRQQTSELQAALNRLPNEQKEAIMLQQFNDFSLEEIAAVAEVSVETIKSRLRYAMRKLRQQFLPQEATRKELVG